MDSPVRRLSIDDLPACQRLAADREWGKEDRKWRFLFSVGDVYGIDDGNGGLAATVVSTPYGKDVAAISMVLVAKRYGEPVIYQAAAAFEGAGDWKEM